MNLLLRLIVWSGCRGSNPGRQPRAAESVTTAKRGIQGCLVGAERLELSTSASRTLRATKLRYAPKMRWETDRV